MSTVIGLETVATTAPPVASVARRSARLARKQPLGVVGIVLVLAVVLATVFAPRLTSFGPEDLSGPSLAAPDTTYWFGTDDLGRDVFSRVVYGGRVSLTVGAIAVLIGCTAGTTLGLLSGYCGGKIDLAVQRLVDACMAFPTLVLALAIVAALGTGQKNVIMAISIAMTPLITRIIRGAVLVLSEEAFVEAACGLGARVPRILLQHVLPNLVGPIVVVATAFFGTAIVTEAALSFVGLGTPPPTPSWGNMM
jgi:ABC-type dipeptide/oligopeptide/nickel transport system permease subunit